MKYIIIALLMTAACSAPSEAGAEASQAVQIEKMDPPARYNAALPANLTQWDSWAQGSMLFAPQTHVVDSLLFGQVTTFRQLKAASRSVPVAEQTAWANRWHDLFKFQIAKQEFCVLARPVMHAPKSVIRMAIAGLFARDCATASDRTLVLRKDTPSRAVLDFFYPYRGYRDKASFIPYNKRLASAAADIITKGKISNARDAAYVMISQKNPQAESALLSIYRNLKDNERKDDIALTFAAANNPELRSLWQEVCARKKTELVCSNDNAPIANETGEDPPKPALADIQAVKAQLVALGFSKAAKLDAQALESTSAEVILDEAGYVYGFDVETGLFPNAHDTLLRQLARLASPALDGAIFEEIAPRNDVCPYQLRAYHQGKKYSIQAENLGDWYDVAAVLTLLDAILADQNAPFALLPLPTQDQTLTIIGGPKSAIDGGVKANIFSRGDVGRAEQLGKAFEKETFETLKKLSPASDIKIIRSDLFDFHSH